MHRIRRRGPSRAYEVRIKRAEGWCWVSSGSHNLAVAKAKLHQLEMQAIDPNFGAAESATTEGLLTDFIDSRKARGRSAGTVSHYLDKMKPLVRLLPRLASGLTHRILEQYVAARAAEGVLQTTVKKELRALGAALALACRNGLFSRSPKSVIPELEETYRPRTRWLAPWELCALAAHLPLHKAARVVWIVATGARWGESERAERGDHGPDAIRIRGTKTELSARIVPILSMTRGLLVWALERVSQEPTGRLFARWPSAGADLHAACRSIGIQPVTPNDLRRTFAQWLRQGGAEPALIGQALGHADARMAERVYGRLGPAELGDAIEARLRSG